MTMKEFAKLVLNAQIKLIDEGTSNDYLNFTEVYKNLVTKEIIIIDYDYFGGTQTISVSDRT